MSDLVNPNSAAGVIAQMPKSSDLVASKYGDDAFDNLATIGDYLPYIQLCIATSAVCQRGVIPIGNHALFKGKQVIDLGRNVQCWVCAWRPVAMMTGDDKPVMFFDPNSAEFKKVQDTASKGQFGDGALCGPQFLLYVPPQGFATYLTASKTAKNEAPNFRGLIDKCAIISSKFIETKKYNWYGPQIVAASQQFDTPDPVEYKEVLTKFLNPAESKVELVNNQNAGESSREV